MVDLNPPLTRLLAFVIAVALSSACATTQAKSKAAEAPALDAPPPPPRVIAPIEPEATLPAAPIPDEPARANQPRPSPTRPPRDGNAGRGGEARAETPKPETETPKPNEGPEAATAPVHRLQPANEAEQERSTVNRITAAERDLSQVDYGRLSASVRNEYNNAKRLLEQAKDALKSRNFVFADSLAEKAATIAASLKQLV